MSRASRRRQRQARREAEQEIRDPTRSESNRINASHSTGPRTTEGKARSRWNALTHGLYARTLTPAAGLLEEDLTEFQSLRDALLEEYAPEGLAEERMIEKMALLCWQHDRLVAHSEQRLAGCLKAGDDIVTALLGREATTMAESRLDRAINRLHRDLLFLAHYRQRAQEADAKHHAKQGTKALLGESGQQEEAGELPREVLTGLSEPQSENAETLGSQGETPVRSADWRERVGTKPSPMDSGYRAAS